MRRFYKLARPDGFDFYTGKTVNYRENIGKTVRVLNFDGEPELCTNTVLHASRNPNDAFIGAEIPCSVYIVKGKPVIKNPEKCGFKELFVIEEVPQDKLDQIFGWRYTEACNPINPFKIKSPKITNLQIELLKNWASVSHSVRHSVWDSVWDSVGDLVKHSVWDSVRDSVWDSVGDSVWDSVRDSVGDSVKHSVWDSVRDSVWDSVGDSVWDSVRDSVWAYIGSLFPNLKKWKYIKHKQGEYPFQPAVDLWKQGLVASFDGVIWRLHGGLEAKILWEEKK